MLLRCLILSFPGLLTSFSMTIEWYACHNSLIPSIIYHILILSLYTLAATSSSISLPLLIISLVIQWFTYLLLAKYYGNMPSFPAFPIQLLNGNSEKLVIITGVNYNGIGYEIARAMIKLNYNLLFIDIHPELHMKTLQSDLQSLNSSITVNYLIGDLTSHQDLAKMISIIRKEYSEIDILINNAGGMIPGLTPSGYSKTIALCLHAPIIFTHELLPLMTKNGRVVVTCSSTSNMLYLFPSPFHISQLQPFSSNATDPSLMNYARAKFCIKYWVKLLHSKIINCDILPHLQNQNICINSYHPGAVGTNIFAPLRSLIGTTLYNCVILFLKLSLRTPQEGAITGVYLASSKEITIHNSGAYYFDCQQVLNEKPMGLRGDEKTLLEELDNYVNQIYQEYQRNTKLL